jgi:pilus assembly protein Flp/PilA
MMLSLLVKMQLSLRRAGGRIRDDDRGATSVEYGLMVALIAMVILLAVKLLGTNLSSLFSKTATNV